MKRELLGVILLAIFLWAALACGATSKITIEGPTQCEVGETVTLKLDIGSVLVVTETTPFGAVGNILKKIQVQNSHEILPIDARPRFRPEGIVLLLEVEVTPEEPGIAFIFVIDRMDESLFPLPVAIHLIQVGEVPGPDPPKPEKGPRYLLFLREKNPHTEALIEVAPQWEAFFNKLRQEEMAGAFKTHAIKDADDDAQETAYAPYLQGKDPKTGEPYRKNDDPTPTLFIIQRESPHKILWCGPSPKTLSTLKAKLTDFGG